MKPLFKENFQPMTNNRNIAFTRYKALRRNLEKYPAMEKMSPENIYNKSRFVDENSLPLTDWN